MLTRRKVELLSGRPELTRHYCRYIWRQPQRSKVASAAIEDRSQPGEEVISIFGPDGVFRFPSRYSSVKKVLQPRIVHPLPSWEEQQLCIGACFQVAATNGWDPSRRVSFQGFCQSVDILLDSVADVVVLRGGEILDKQRAVKSGVHEELKLIVAMPFLWGVPPTLDCLRDAIEVGGGIVDRVYHRWDIY